MGQLISKILIVTLLFSMIGVNGFVVDTNADNTEANTLPQAYTAPYSSVKNQRPFGSCWMFGCISAAESNLLKKTGRYGQGLVEGNPIDLSEAQAIYTFYNQEKDNGGNIKNYSSNDARILNPGKEEFLGYSGGGLPVDAAMALIANKGSALESDNSFLCQQNYPEYYLSNDEEQNEDELEDIKEIEEQEEIVNGGEIEETTDIPAEETTTNPKLIAVHDMAEKAASQYKLNRFNIKSAEELPEMYPYKGTVADIKQYSVDPDAKRIWKQKIYENGAIYASFHKAKDEENSKEDRRFKYYHAWREGDDKYYDKDYRPNYWFFSKRHTANYNNHVISIVGYDDKYSKYNFVERLNDPKTDELRDYDSNIADIEYIEEENGRPVLTFKDNGEIESVSTSESSKPGYAKYIVPKDDGAWIVKNSYGTKGDDDKKIFENGIMHISYCESSLAAGISLVVDENLDEICNNEKKYNYTLTHSSIKGATWDDFHGFLAAEVFTTEKEMDIGQIGYWTGEENTNSRFRIYKNLTDLSKPDSGTLVYDSYDSPNSFNDTQFGIHNLGHEVYLKDTFKGYHTLEIKNPIHVNKNDTLSVVICQKYCDAETNSWKSGIMLEKDVAYTHIRNEGDTFVCLNRKTNEWKEITNPAMGNTTVKLFGNAINKVVIDGEETIVPEGDTFTFPTTSENGYVSKDYSKLYEPSQSIQVTEDLTANSIPKIDCQMLPGASIRTQAPEGVRFVSEVSCNDKDLLRSDSVTFGTLITTNDFYNCSLGKKLTLDTYENNKDKIQNVPNSNWFKNEVGRFSAGLINVKKVNWNRKFVSQGYMTLNYSNGKHKTLYAGVSTPRSIVEVAQNIENDGYKDCSETEIAFIKNILDEE